jgi:hypothetical protein
MPYFFSAPTANVQPYLYWTANNPAQSPSMVPVSLPAIFTTPLTTAWTSGPFAFTPATVGTPVTQSYIQLTAAGSVISTFDNTPIRSSLRTAVLALYEALEAEGLLPGALALVQQSLAQYLPLTFTETLFYRYGLDPVGGYVDVQPGMRLRVDFQSHQEIDPSPTDALNGFVGSGTSYIEVVEQSTPSGSLLTTFDPFISALAKPSVAPNTGGGGGAIDTHGMSFAYAYYRLFFPSSFPSADSTGSAAFANNVVLFGASSRTNLETATTAYLQNGSFGSTPGIAVWFRGRTVVTPEVAVVVHGAPEWVTLGTTLRGVLRRFAAIPRMNPTSVLPNVASQVFYRWMIGIAVIGNQVLWSYPASLGGAVTLSGGGGYAYYSPVLDSLDLPLVGGDDILFGSAFPSGS